MKKAVLLLAIMVSATFLATAQEGGKVKYTVSGEKVTFTRTLTAVPAGTMVVKKPPVAGNTAKKRSAPPEHSARDSRGTNSSETPAWKRAKAENEQKFSGIKKDIDEIQDDISSLKRNDAIQDYRLNLVETQTQYLLSQNLSNAQLLQRGVENKENRASLDLERRNRNKKTARTVFWVGVGVGAAVVITRFFINSINRANAPYVPPQTNGGNQNQFGNSDPGLPPPAPSGE